MTNGRQAGERPNLCTVISGSLLGVAPRQALCPISLPSSDPAVGRLLHRPPWGPFFVFGTPEFFSVRATYQRNKERMLGLG